jgi:hypothetical protein
MSYWNNEIADPLHLLVFRTKRNAQNPPGVTKGSGGFRSLNGHRDFATGRMMLSGTLCGINWPARESW